MPVVDKEDVAKNRYEAAEIRCAQAMLERGDNRKVLRGLFYALRPLLNWFA